MSRAILIPNNRCFTRIIPVVSQPIRIDINGENFIDILCAKDICLGGVSIKVPHRFEGCEVNELISILVNLPMPVNRSLSLEGMIIHTGDDIFGIKFSAVPKRSLNDLRKYISSLLGDRSTLFRFLFQTGFTH